MQIWMDPTLEIKKKQYPKTDFNVNKNGVGKKRTQVKGSGLGGFKLGYLLEENLEVETSIISNRIICEHYF